VAELLGYSTQTSFTRWFKNEFGVAPTQWQRPQV
jgi:AraC-like DNA-binding protein